jgi:EmrB/QacA subfamily drug resistance transporter
VTGLDARAGRPSAGGADAPPVRLWLVFVGLMLSMSLAALDLLIVATAVPEMTDDLGGSVTQGAWIFTAYLLGTTCTMPLWGKLGDLYGRRRLFLVGIGMFMVASVAAGSAQTMGQLVGARLLQGIGGAALTALPNAIIGDIVNPRDRGRYMGVTSSVWAAAAVAGPFVGGFFVDGVGWRWVFFVNIPTGLLAMTLIGPALRGVQQRRVEHRIDVPGAVLLVAAVGAAVLLASLGGEQVAWSSPWIAVLAAAAVVAGVAFVAWERRATEPLVPLHLFTIPAVRASTIATFVFGLANFGSAILVPLYAHAVNGLSATSAGLTLMPVSVGIFFASTLVGRRISHTGRYRWYPPVGVGLFALSLVLMTTWDASTGRPFAWACAFLTGVGSGMLTPVLVITAQNAVRYRSMGTATALVTFARAIGQTIGGAVLGTLVAGRLTHHIEDLVAPADRAGLDVDELRSDPDDVAELGDRLHDLVVEAFRRAITDGFWFMIAIAVCAGIAALWIPEIPLRETIDDEADDAAADALAPSSDHATIEPL